MRPMAWVGTWLRYLARLRLAPFVPAPRAVGSAMLDLARLRQGEKLLDLGCGDGRLLVQAVQQYGASGAVGYELDDHLVESSRAVAGSDARIHVRQEDALTSGDAVADADVVALYLTERGNAALLPLLRERLRPSARVVSYCWGLDGLPPSRTAQAIGPGVIVQFPNVMLWERKALWRSTQSCSELKK